MHPEDETVHALNAHRVRAEELSHTQSIPITTPTPEPVPAFAVRRPTGLPSRYRRGGDTLARIACAFCVGAVLFVGAWVVGGVL